MEEAAIEAPALNDLHDRSIEKMALPSSSPYVKVNNHCALLLPCNLKSGVRHAEELQLGAYSFKPRLLCQIANLAVSNHPNPKAHAQRPLT